MHVNCFFLTASMYSNTGFMFAFFSGHDHHGFLYVPCCLYINLKCALLCFTTHLHARTHARTHTRTRISFAWIMTFSFWCLPTFQSSLGGDRAGSLTSAIQGQCGRQAGRQAGRQLYYSSGMAGSAEGEALTPILMRLCAAQWPGVCGRIRQKQSHGYQRAYCLVENPLPFRKKKKFPASFSLHQFLKHFDISAAH